MLDTDISSYIIKRRPSSLAEKFQKHAEALCVSAMTAAELRFGVQKSGRPELAEYVEAFLERLAILDWTDEVTHHYARIRFEVERVGKPVGNMDLLIAAHAISERATLITNNVRHFSHIPGLKINEWANEWA